MDFERTGPTAGAAPGGREMRSSRDAIENTAQEQVRETVVVGGGGWLGGRRSVAAAATATRCLAVFATALSSGACAEDGPRQRCTCASAAICLALAAIDDETTPTTPTKNTTTFPAITLAISQWVAQVRTRPPSLSPRPLTSPLPIVRARPPSLARTRPLAFARPGWLFLFSVLMAAGLLFTMVFFVRPLIL